MDKSFVRERTRYRTRLAKIEDNLLSSPGIGLIRHATELSIAAGSVKDERVRAGLLLKAAARDFYIGEGGVELAEAHLAEVYNLTGHTDLETLKNEIRGFMRSHRSFDYREFNKFYQQVVETESGKITGS